MFAVSLLDGEGQSDRQIARVCSWLGTVAMNVARSGGVNIPDKMYKDEGYFMPSYANRNVRRTQSIQEIKSALGFN